jgi:hypothetical protein
MVAMCRIRAIPTFHLISQLSHELHQAQAHAFLLWSATRNRQNRSLPRCSSPRVRLGILAGNLYADETFRYRRLCDRLRQSADRRTLVNCGAIAIRDR